MLPGNRGLRGGVLSVRKGEGMILNNTHNSHIDRQARMERLRSEALTCPACANQGRRVRVVFGEGDVAAPVMLVSQGPGVFDEQSGRPFSGPSGALLDQALAEVGLQRDKLWLTNVIKCRAVKQEKGRLIDRPPSAV